MLDRSRSRDRSKTGGAFSPAGLFVTGAQGAWYDPSDYSTLFQNSTGTTPVTAVEQPVRLMLDRSRGLVLGPELVTNGGFDTDVSGWSTAGASSFEFLNGTGRLTTDGSASFPQINQNLPSLTPGVSLRVSATVSNNTTTRTMRVLIFNLTDNTTAFDSLSTTVNGTIVATWPQGSIVGKSYRLIILANGTAAAGVTVDFDNISVRELPGNHALAPNDASRPILRARYNLLTFSEQFDNAGWGKVQSTVTANAAVAPDGTMTADFLLPNTTSNQHRVDQTPVTVAGLQTFSVFAKASGYDFVSLRIGSAGKSFNLSSGVVGTSGAASATITPFPNGWYRCAITVSAAANDICRINVDNVDSVPTVFTGDGTSGILIWGAQLLTAADQASTGGAYQRIAAATDYDTSNPVWRPYLAFDGSDDSMSTSSIDFNTVTSDGQPRRNLLVNPTQFDAAAWTKTRATVTANTAVAPDGTTTADTFTEDSTASSTHFFVGPSSGAPSYTTAATVTASIFVKIASGTRNVAIRVAGSNGSAVAIYNPSTGAFVTSTTTGTNWTFVSSSVTALADGWYRITCTGTHTETSGGLGLLCNLADDSNLTYTGDGTSGAYIWGAQLETGSTATAFQDIGTDEMTVFAGVHKASDAATGAVLELTASGTNGSIGLFAPLGAAANYEWRSRGTALAQATTGNTFAAPITNVLTGIGDIGGDVATLRVNGTQAATSATDQGTDNYANAALFIGRRGGSSLPFNGRLYGLTVLGRTATAAELGAMEAWVASKTGVNLP